MSWAIRMLLVWLVMGSWNPGPLAEAQQRYPWYDQTKQTPTFVDPNTTSWDGSANRKIVQPALPPPRWPSWLWPDLPDFWGYVAWSLIILIALAAMAVLIGLVWKRSRGSAVSQLSLADDTQRRERILSLPFPLEESPGDCRSLAEQAFQAGNYRRAMIYLFSHALVHLDRHSLLQLKRGKTNREYVRELARWPAPRAYLSSLVDPFEAVFFGNKEIRREQLEDLWQRLPEFERIVESTQPLEVVHS